MEQHFILKGNLEPPYCKDCKKFIEQCGYGYADCNNQETEAGFVNRAFAQAILDSREPQE